MDRNETNHLWKLLSSREVLKKYKGRIVHKGPKETDGYHDWADFKPIHGIIELTNPDYFDPLHLLLIQWPSKRIEWYLVIFPATQKQPYLEIRHLREKDGKRHLEWTFQPCKRDGRNPKRKDAFKSYFPDTKVQIPYPESSTDVPPFLDDLFHLTESRLNAEKLIFGVSSRKGFPEGRKVERLHLQIERNKTLIETAKTEYIRKHGHCKCQVCGFDFEATYGSIGKNFIEGHHTRPLGDLSEEIESQVQDITIVCSNCHSMLHRRRPWLSMEELSKLVIS